MQESVCAQGQVGDTHEQAEAPDSQQPGSTQQASARLPPHHGAHGAAPAQGDEGREHLASASRRTSGQFLFK